ncbi:YesL family protein [Paenibacillus sp. GCM10027628]|uniref:YesL family protein n=1 Tax=Paenibacillus sp. GCM10027628 TaxID=3273413 RepID=UPI00363C7448
MEFRGVMGGLYRISEWIMRLSVINLLWILCSIPVFFFGFMGLVSQSPDALMSTLPILAILTPFTLFPATAAMFTVARKWVTGEEDVPLLKTFFRGYKENYVQSMVGGLLFVVIFAIIIVNYFFYIKQGSTLKVLAVLFIAFTVIVTISLFNFFSIMVHLHMKVLQIVKNSILITIGNPINSIVMLICNGVIVYICLTKLNFFLVVFFMGSIMATFSFWQFNRSFTKLQMKQQELEEKEQMRLAEAQAEEAANEAENGTEDTTEDPVSKKEMDKHKSEETEKNKE